MSDNDQHAVKSNTGLPNAGTPCRVRADGIRKCSKSFLQKIELALTNIVTLRSLTL